MGARVTRCSGNATGAQRGAYSQVCGAATAKGAAQRAARRQDPLREQRVPRLYWAMRWQDPRVAGDRSNSQRPLAELVELAVLDPIQQRSHQQLRIPQAKPLGLA